MCTWYELAAMTWGEFASVRPRILVALKPIGATEQHGPHMMLHTDTRIAHALAQRLAAAVHPDAIVLPPFRLGISYHHLDFPGTLSVSEASLHSVFIDVARSLKRHGIRKLVFVNGHMGNMAGLGALVTRLRYEEEIEASVVFYFNQASDEIAKHVKSPRWGHACEIEASVGLALVPATVRGDAVQPSAVKPLPYRFAGNLIPFAFHEMTDNGALGDDRQATREAGEAIVTVAIERAAAFLRDFLREDGGINEDSLG